MSPMKKAAVVIYLAIGLLCFPWAGAEAGDKYQACLDGKRAAWKCEGFTPESVYGVAFATIVVWPLWISTQIYKAANKPT